MNKIFLIGDTHFCHRNIIKYCCRPFSSVEEMNEELISKWNSVVGKNDIVYVVGDFALGGKDKIIKIGQRLNGRKRLILGNHDGASRVTYQEIFEYVYDKPIILEDFLIVSHYPRYVQPNGLYANIYAHVHDDPSYFDFTSRSFCVSAERIDYTPIDLSLIIKAMKTCEGYENGEENNC